MLGKISIRSGSSWLSNLFVAVMVSLLAFCFIGGKSQAQNPPFSSGSTGHEGALNITAAGVTLFDPVAMNLNPVVPGIFNFTTINIAAGSTLKFTENKYHGAVYLLASGDVTIAGTMDLSGDNSYGSISFASQRVPNAAGSGGYSGGVGGFGSNPPLPGNGPGGGATGTSGGNNVYGRGGTNTSNQFLVPIIGGSGGGGEFNDGTIGGAGGGALLIASSTTITVNGSINASGGNGSNGGGGAGGAVRLVANTIGGSGTSNVNGGSSTAGASFANTLGGAGLARFESNNLGGISVSGPTTRSVPLVLNLPTIGAPSIKVTSINGQPINSNPFSFPDITINTTSPVPIVVQATNVPVGTIAKIYVFNESVADQVINIGPLTGADQSLTTATANITLPTGGSRGYVKATW